MVTEWGPNKFLSNYLPAVLSLYYKYNHIIIYFQLDSVLQQWCLKRWKSGSSNLIERCRRWIVYVSSSHLFLIFFIFFFHFFSYICHSIVPFKVNENKWIFQFSITRCSIRTEIKIKASAWRIYMYIEEIESKNWKCFLLASKNVTSTLFKLKETMYERTSQSFDYTPFRFNSQCNQLHTQYVHT